MVNMGRFCTGFSLTSSTKMVQETGVVSDGICANMAQETVLPSHPSLASLTPGQRLGRVPYSTTPARGYSSACADTHQRG
jgi:hypothetical protein